MKSALAHPTNPGNTRTRLLDAAMTVIRTRGYSATSVDDICQAAGVTKGAFFHHFESKEALAVTAADHFSAKADSLFAAAPYHDPSDPLDRLVAYVDFRKSILRGELPDYTCLLGTMVQEAYDSHPLIREACDRCLRAHAATLEPDIAEAIGKYGVSGHWTPAGLALYTQAVIQGAFILAKAAYSAQAAAACLDHLRRYLELLFRQPSAGNQLSSSPSR